MLPLQRRIALRNVPVCRSEPRPLEPGATTVSAPQLRRFSEGARPDEPAARTLGRWSEPLARLRPPNADHQRRAPTPARRRDHGGDLEPVDLRQGDRGFDRLRRRDVTRIASDGRDHDPLEVFYDPRDRRHPDGRRRAPAALRHHRGTRRVRELRGRAAAGARHRGVDRGRPAPVGAARPPERPDQDPRHARGSAGDRAGDRRRDQRERHAPVQPSRRTRGWWPRTSAGSSVASSPANPSTASPPWPRSSSPASTRPWTRGCPRIRLCAAPRRSRTPRSRTNASGSSSRASAGSDWPPPAPASSDRSGPRPRRRTPPTRTRCTSTRSWAATP